MYKLDTDDLDSHPANARDCVGWVKSERIRIREVDDPFELVVPGRLSPIDIEYETYGKLNKEKSNAILVCHALSGDAHAAGWDITAKDNKEKNRQWRLTHPGWWDSIIGPGKPLDTDRYFIICSNFIGSCYGSTGPSSINPLTKVEYGSSFPIVTVHDWVKIEAEFLDKIGIDRLVTVIGGSLGGQQAIEWGLQFPDRVDSICVLAASPRLSTQGLAFNAVGRYSIMNDKNFNGGNYYGKNHPDSGLAAARMLAHITYLSEEGMHNKFGRRLQGKTKPDFNFNVEFEVESYLSHQGLSFVDRFDANSYLYITKAMDYYDPASFWGGGDLVEAMKKIKASVIVISFSSDWLYPPDDCMEFAWAIARNNQPVTYADIPSIYGHDAFLVEKNEVSFYLRHFLGNLKNAK